MVPAYVCSVHNRSESANLRLSHRACIPGLTTHAAPQSHCRLSSPPSLSTPVCTPIAALPPLPSSPHSSIPFLTLPLLPCTPHPSPQRLCPLLAYSTPPSYYLPLSPLLASPLCLLSASILSVAPSSRLPPFPSPRLLAVPLCPCLTLHCRPYVPVFMFNYSPYPSCGAFLSNPPPCTAPSPRHLLSH